MKKLKYLLILFIIPFTLQCESILSVEDETLEPEIEAMLTTDPIDEGSTSMPLDDAEEE